MTATPHRDGERLPNGKFVGRAVLRLEDLRFLTGAGMFIDDLRVEGMVHAVVARSPHSHAVVTRIETAAVSALPGVIDVITAADIEGYPGAIPIRLGPLPGFHRFLQRPLASGTVRYVGEPIAVVVAESRHLAEDALAYLIVEYEPLGAL